MKQTWACCLIVCEIKWAHDGVKPHAVRPKAKPFRVPSSTFRSPLIFWTPLKTDYPIMCTHLVLDLWLSMMTHELLKLYRWLLWHAGHLQLSSFNFSPDIELKVGAASLRHRESNHDSPFQPWIQTPNNPNMFHLNTSRSHHSSRASKSCFRASAALASLMLASANHDFDRLKFAQRSSDPWFC